MVNETELSNKIVKFMKEYDTKEYDPQIVKEYFTGEELAYVLTDRYAHDFVISRFFDYIINLPDIISSQVAEKFVVDSEYSNESIEALSSFLSKEFLFDLYKRASILNEDYSAYNICYYLKSDEALEEFLKIAKNKDDCYCAVTNFSTDDLKIKYLSLLTKEDKSRIVASLQDDYFKVKYLRVYTLDKGLIIASISDDELKLKMYKRFYLFMKREDKNKIITSLNDKELILNYGLKLISGIRGIRNNVKQAISYDSEVVEFITELSNVKHRDIIIELIKRVRNKNEYFYYINRLDLTIEEIEELFGDIKNGNHIVDLISFLPDELKLKYVLRCSDKNKIEVLDRNLGDSDYAFATLCSVKSFKKISDFVEHMEVFPKYNKKYDVLLDRYSVTYHLNKEHLNYLCNNVGYDVLKVIKNNNIKKLINSSDEVFMNTMGLIDAKEQKMSLEALNTVMNALLQREFRLKNPDIIMVFPLILQAVQDNNKDKVTELVNSMYRYMDVNAFLEKYGLKIDVLIDKLMVSDEEAIKCVHEMASSYIRNKRSDYVKDNLDSAFASSANVRADKNSLSKYIFANLPPQLLLKCFPDGARIKKNHNSTYDYNEGFTAEELDLLEDRELLEQIIRYKCNPKAYDAIPELVKKNMKTFNSIVAVMLERNYFSQFINQPGIKVNYEPKEINNDFILSILMNLDVDKASQDVYSNKVLFNKLKKLLIDYKIIGWGDDFDRKLADAGVLFDAEVVANLIQYFDLAYGELEKRVENGELPSITLTALLDLCACYGMESKKYSFVFGNSDFKYISSNPSPNSSTMSKDSRVNKAIELLRVARNRKYVTVPPMDKDFSLTNGKKLNVVVGNASNPINLTYGERTGACMRIGGAGDSLFRFCLEDENGFHIRFSDEAGSLVSRVSGFRNGNTVFLNQLRYSLNSNYSDMDVVEVCKMVAKELILQSKDSDYPIDNVVISNGCAMGRSSMFDQNLGVKDIKKGLRNFYSDVYGSAIVLATSNPDGSLVPVKLGAKKAPRYECQRDKIKMLYNTMAIDAIAHLKAMDEVMCGRSVDDVDIRMNEDIVYCIAGEDWYVSIDKNGKIEHFIMKSAINKNKSMDELQEALQYVKDNVEYQMQIASGRTLG